MYRLGCLNSSIGSAKLVRPFQSFFSSNFLFDNFNWTLFTVRTFQLQHCIMFDSSFQYFPTQYISGGINVWHTKTFNTFYLHHIKQLHPTPTPYHNHAMCLYILLFHPTYTTYHNHSNVFIHPTLTSHITSVITPKVSTRNICLSFQIWLQNIDSHSL